MERGCGISVLALVALAALPLAHTQTVWSISPATGSLEGGTKLLIQGTGFKRDGMDGQTIV